MYRKVLTFYLISLILIISSHSFAQQLSPQEKEWLTKSYRSEKNGWIFLHIEGKPFERGFQRGYLTANEIEEFFKMLDHTEKFETAKEIDFFVDAAAMLFKDNVSEEYVEEMKGMVQGMRSAGKKITYEEMLFMNGFIDILWHWWPQEAEKEKIPNPGCSAFIATGGATANGKIVMAHNSWYLYYSLRFCNIIVDIVPDKGHRILMQSWGPCLYSATDFFITAAGLVGTETTIGKFSGFNKEGTPVFERARKAMQYANNIDEWTRIMIENNNGAYANSWLLGDIRTNEIARLELGLKHHSVEKKKDGYFTGSNIVDNINILREETDASYDDVRDFCVARRVRWKQLMKKHYGKIDVEISKSMLADHYDVYLEKEEPSFRTICGHWETDNGIVPGTWGAYLPGGAIDGKVVDSEMAKNWKLWARWGHPCGIEFNAKKFIEKHAQYEWVEEYLLDIPAMPWTIFPIMEMK
ncbi:MAG: phospholipase [Candidatus Marinimicrobia bacterium]|nr:phospholipase [Candidatus Neomarinimicrobiota bacterium]